MRYLKQSTSVDVGIGPFLDETDGKTAETALTITQPDIRLKKNGGAWAQKAAAQTLTHEENGWYEVTLDATDTDTIGHLLVAVHESGALPVWMEFHVLAANVYDSLFGAATDKLDVNVEEWNTTAVPAEHTAGYPIVTIKDGTGTGEINTTSGRVDADITHIAASAVSTSSAQLGVNVVNAGGTAWGSGAITAASIATDAITAAKIAADAIGASELAADAVTEIQAGLSTLTAAQVQTECEEALQAYHLDHLIASADPGSVVANSSFLAKLVSKSATPAFSSYDNTTDSLEAIRDRGDAAWITGSGGLDAAGVRAAVGLASANLDTQLSAIDDYIDTEVAAIKAKTDQLTFTTANRVDCQVFGLENTVITAASIASNAITSAKIAADAIGATQIAADAITAAKLAADCITAAKIADNAIDAGALAADCITAAKIATGAIDADALAADVVNDIWMGTALTEAYASDGAAATPAQLLYMIWSALAEFSISGTTITAKKLDGSTSAMTFTLDSSSAPTSRTRAS